eukprot:6127343-Ditylum_brightwellii.AAC.1
MLFFLKAASFLNLTSIIFNSFNNIKKKVVSASSLVKQQDFEKLRPLLGWMPLEVIKRTIDCTTQLAMGSLLPMPFR